VEKVPRARIQQLEAIYRGNGLDFFTDLVGLAREYGWANVADYVGDDTGRVMKLMTLEEGLLALNLEFKGKRVDLPYLCSVVEEHRQSQVLKRSPLGPLFRQVSSYLI
jgi:hypothetical protein